jgi:hypothetical protein
MVLNRTEGVGFGNATATGLRWFGAAFAWFPYPTSGLPDSD